MSTNPFARWAPPTAPACPAPYDLTDLQMASFMAAMHRAMGDAGARVYPRDYELFWLGNKLALRHEYNSLRPSLLAHLLPLWWPAKNLKAKDMERYRTAPHGPKEHPSAEADPRRCHQLAVV